MLTKPVGGWSYFSLINGGSQYELSYLNDIAFEWVEQAIHGLETMMPFCVKGFMEPYRFLCTVSYWNCHITIENDGPCPLSLEDVSYCWFHTSMIEFCKYLYEDIMQYIDEWAEFAHDDKTGERKEELIIQLDKLKELISEKEENFGDNRCFF